MRFFVSETLPETTEVKESNNLEFKDGNLTVQIEQKPGCMAKFNVIISPLASQAVYEKAIKSVSKEVSLPGFRKGKAPRDTLLKYYSDAIKSEWERKLLQSSASEAIELSGKRPYADDSIREAKLIKASRDENSEISFQVECAPAVPHIKLADIVVKRVRPEVVGEKEIDDELCRLQLQKASWEPIEGREAHEGDYVDLTINSKENDPQLSVEKARLQPISESARFLLQEGKMAPWMHRVVKGLKVGDTVDATVEVDNAETEEMPSPEELQCKITLDGIYKAVLPEIDEAFTKQFDSSSVEELRKKINARLTRQFANNAWKAMEGQVVEQLLVNYPFDIPEREHVAEARIQYQRLENRLEDSNLSAADKVRMVKDIERYVGSLPNNYRLFYIARLMAKSFHIKITEQELSSEITHHLLLSRASYDTLVDETMDPRLIQAMIYNHLQLHKVIQFILKNAQLVD